MSYFARSFWILSMISARSASTSACKVSSSGPVRRSFRIKRDHFTVNKLDAEWTVLPPRALKNVIQCFGLGIGGDVLRFPQVFDDFVFCHTQ